MNKRMHALLFMLLTAVNPAMSIAGGSKAGKRCAWIVGNKPRVVNQCGNTCFLDSAVSFVESRLKKDSPRIAISRSALLAQYVAWRLENRLNGISTQDWEIEFASRRSEADIKKLSFFERGGNISDLVQIINSRGLVINPDPSAKDLDEDHAALEDLVTRIDNAYQQTTLKILEFSKRFKGVMLRENPLVGDEIEKLKAILRTEIRDLGARPNFRPDLKLSTPIRLRGMDEKEVKNFLQTNIPSLLEHDEAVLISYKEYGDRKHAALIVGYIPDNKGRARSLRLQHSWGEEGEADEYSLKSPTELARTLRAVYVLK